MKYSCLIIFGLLLYAGSSYSMERGFYTVSEPVRVSVETHWHTVLRYLDIGITYATYISTMLLIQKTINHLLLTRCEKLDAIQVDDIFFLPLSLHSQERLHQFTADNFSAYINSLLVGKQEEEIHTIKEAIVTQYNLYQFSGFLACIVQWPEFKMHMTHLSTALSSNEALAQKFDTLQGFAKGEFSRCVHLHAQQYEQECRLLH